MTHDERLGDDPAHGLGPTRARVLALLQDAHEPMTAGMAAERLGLHVNGARFHLEALAEAGLVERQREERSTPGRPRMLYVARAESPAVAHRSYRLLAEMLTSYLADTLPDPAASAEQAGYAWGRHLTAPGAARESQALETLVATLDRVGFESQVVRERRALRLEVSHCPFLEVAEKHDDVVCSVHLGLMRGVLEQTGAPVTAAKLEPFVEPGLCIARLERRPA